jgi:hypothetical protein
VSKPCNGLPGQCAGGKAHRAYMYGHAQYTQGRPLEVAGWAHSKRCREMWELGYNDARTDRAEGRG